jgi:hypothetical protein
MTSNKKPTKILEQNHLNMVIQDLGLLYTERKASAKKNKKTNEVKGIQTELSFITLNKLLKEYMTTSNHKTIPLLPGCGTISLDEKKTLPSIEETLISFYPYFQEHSCNRQISLEETEAFITMLRERREETRKPSFILRHVEE